MQLVRTIEQNTGLPFKKVIQIVNHIPKVIKKDLSKEKCDKLVASLNELGAVVEVIRQTKK